MDLWELKKKPHLSASSINDYVECSLSYKFGRIDKIPIEFKADALEFGTAIHLVLGDFYQNKMVGINLSLKDVHKVFEIQWTLQAEGRDDIQYAKDNDFDSLLLQGKELLTAWYNKLPDDNFKILGIEEAFSFTLPGLSIPIIGAIDLMEEDESGTIIITDFKTSRRSYSSDEIDKNLQMTIYKMAMKANGFHDREILLRFDCLVKTKKPKFEQYWTARNEVDEKRIHNKAIQVWKGIRQGIFIPNDQSWRCKNCSYSEVCKEWSEKEVAA